MKFHDEMLLVQKDLQKLGHKVLMPEKVKGVDYWAKDNKLKVKAKKNLELISEHLNKIKKSNAILVINISKNEIDNYIGANTFLEMGVAYYWGKKIFSLNPLPTQPYIVDELLTFDPIVIKGNVKKIK